jgi:hypothetical protein
MSRPAAAAAAPCVRSCVCVHTSTKLNLRCLIPQVGYPPNIGIVPMAFDRLFKTIAENTDPNTTYAFHEPCPLSAFYFYNSSSVLTRGAVFCNRFEVTFSMLEVYMEAVADLIAQPSTRKKGGLKVRQNPKLGR